MQKYLITLAASACLLQGCVPHPELPKPDPGSADFSRVVVLGGSELSGYQDGALYREGQTHGIGALLAKQFQSVGGGEFSQALLPEGVSFGLNKRWESRFLTASRLGDRTDCNQETSLGPVRDTVSESSLSAAGVWSTPFDQTHDFAIPFANISDWFSQGLGSSLDLDGPHPFAHRYAFSAANQSMLDAAMVMDPTFFVLWPGMADVFNWSRNGGYGVTLPTPSDFQNQLESALSILTQNGAKGVMATLPEISHFPYFTTIPARGLDLSQSLADSLNDIYGLSGVNIDFREGENGFIVADPGSTYGFRQMEANEYITLSVPLDSMKCYLLGVMFQLLPDRYSLIQSELSFLSSQIEAYNTAIRQAAATHDLALVEMEPFFGDLEDGIRIDAVDFDSRFVSGGFFSLDGWHANPKGAGILTNLFISAINQKYGSTIPPVSLHELRGILFP
jgi:hypothetical protein